MRSHDPYFSTNNMDSAYTTEFSNETCTQSAACEQSSGWQPDSMEFVCAKRHPIPALQFDRISRGWTRGLDIRPDGTTKKNPQIS
mmetsp:Transcript_16860/g.38699  ORF Transcript_16860/g.38699 Transcript_16860/m.38699 type:complete len:85 (-) Transcript_16860:300-554(-)